MPYNISMGTFPDPQKQIQALGERGIDVQVVDPESGTGRLIKVNPFDLTAPPFKGDGGIVEVCNTIKRELSAQNEKSVTKSISRPSRTPDMSIDKQKSQEKDEGISLGGRG